MRIRSLFTVLFLVATVGTAAAAEDVRSQLKLNGMNRVALEDYDLGDHEGARKRLEAALALAKDAKLDGHKLTATTNLYLGIVYAGGLKDPARAVDHFRAALAIDENVTVPEKLVKPEIARAFEEARKPAKVENVDINARPEGVIKGIVHTPVDRASEGGDIPVGVWIGDEMRAASVTMHYRAQGADGFTALEMKGTEPNRYQAMIPAAATATDALQYYVEVKNKKGKVVAAKGNASQPYTISIARIVKKDESGVPVGDDDVDDEDPLKQKKKKGK